MISILFSPFATPLPLSSSFFLLSLSLLSLSFLFLNTRRAEQRRPRRASLPAFDFVFLSPPSLSRSLFSLLRQYRLLPSRPAPPPRHLSTYLPTSIHSFMTFSSVRFCLFVLALLVLLLVALDRQRASSCRVDTAAARSHARTHDAGDPGSFGVFFVFPLFSFRCFFSCFS